jgi:predicted pyridoxine 5'-phosphate oxidase superfamily flavin-nucleotide-binding protein
MGSRGAYARRDTGPDTNDRLGPSELAFIAERDGFYIASVSETGWPYVQFRGGPPGFLRFLDDKTLGFADFRGNRQYVTTGNVAVNNRVSLFLMNYVDQQRLKIFGRLKVVDPAADPALTKNLSVLGYAGRVERAALITVEAFDWNCPQHITPRFTEAELAAVLAPLREQMASLVAENDELRAKPIMNGAPAA